MKAIILAGGRGSRLRPITTTLNKHLIPIAGEPMIFRVIKDVVDIGIKDIIVNLNKGDNEIPRIVGDGTKWGVNIEYIEQEIPNGMMYPILMAEQLIGQDNFVLCAGDNVLHGGLQKYYNEFLEFGSDAHLLVTKVRNPERFGVAVVEGNKMIKTVEKPESFISDLAVTAVYFYTPAIFEAMKNVQPIIKGNSKVPEFYPPPAHQWLIDQGYQVTVTEVTGWWKDTGKPEDLLEGNALLLEDVDAHIQGKVDNESIIQGKVQIGNGTIIKGKSIIRGPAIIGKNCEITDSHIGPYTSIGDNAKIVGSEIDNSIVLDNAFVDVRVRIVDSLLGNDCVIVDKHERLPFGHRLIVGDHSYAEL